MASESDLPAEIPDTPANQRGADARDSCGAEADLHRGMLPADRAAFGPPHAACLPKGDSRWARSLGAYLRFSDVERCPAMNQAIVAPLVRQLRWTHHTNIIGQCKRTEERGFHQSSAPTGQSTPARGNAPGTSIPRTQPALKGRPNRCHSPSRAFTSIWCSVRRIANPASRTPFARNFTPTWRWFFKISVPHPFSSIPSKITSTSCSTSGAPHPSAKRSRMSKNHHPNGSKPRERNWQVLPGRAVTGPSPFPNPTSRRSGNTSQTSANIIGRRPFRRNSANSSNATGFHLMNGMSGIERQVRAPFQGSLIPMDPGPRALPWATFGCPVGAQDPSANDAIHPSANGAIYPSANDAIHPSANGAIYPSANDAIHPSANGSSPPSANGATYASPGQRPGFTASHPQPALKGRPNR